MVVKVIGVGGAGADCVSGMIARGLTGVEFIVADSQFSESLVAAGVSRVWLEEVAQDERNRPECGDPFAAPAHAAIRNAVCGAQVVLIAASMDGKAASHATPSIAGIARSSGALTLAFVTRPCDLACADRQVHVAECIAALERQVDALFLIHHGLGAFGSKARTSVRSVLDEHLLKASACAIAKLASAPESNGVAFDDLRELMKSAGMSVAATAGADGPLRGRAAVDGLFASGSLSVAQLGRARGVATVILTPDGGAHPLQTREIRETAEAVHAHCAEDAFRVFGAASMDQVREVQVVVLACGVGHFDHS